MSEGSAPHRRREGPGSGPPVRLLYVVATLERGGTESLVRDWCENLHGHGFDCGVLCLVSGTGPHVEPLERLGVPVRELRQSAFSGTAFTRALAGVVREARPDIVHSQCAWSLPQQAIGARRGGAGSFVLTVHNTYAPGGLFARARRRLGMRLAGRHVERIVGVSDAVSSYARRWLGIPPERIQTIHNGIRLSRFTDVTESKAVLRERLGFPAEALLAVTVAGFSRQKDHAALLGAAGLLKGRMPSLKFLLVGDGTERDAIEQLARKLELGDTVRFLGRRDDVPRILKASDLFVLPSRWEGMPLCLLEAHAAGLPVVSTAVGGVAEIVRHGRSGLLVPPGDARALSGAIDTLARTPAEADAMGREGRAYVSRRFDIGTCVARYRELYALLSRDEAGKARGGDRR